jgi:hypothetical protein
MEETWHILQLYWKHCGESEYVFPSRNGRSCISGDRANDALKTTWIQAFPDRPDVKIRFHELRSYKMSVLSNAGVNAWQIKRMVGKKNPNAIQTYLTSINLKDSFTKAEAALRLTQATSIPSQLEHVEAALAQLQKENSSIRTVAEVMTKKVTTLEQELADVLAQRKDLEPLVEFAKSFKNRDELLSFLGSFKSASLIRFPEHKLRVVLEKLEGREDTWVMISEIFHEAWENLTEQTLDLVLKRLQKEDNR